MPNLVQYQVSSEHAARCTAQRRNGRFCDEPSIEDAPFPICIKHAAQVLQHLNGYIRGWEALPMDLRMFTYDVTKSEAHTRQAMQAWREAPEETVYYLLVGKHVKIGYTKNLKQRLQGYPPDSKLLATEPGGANTENRRHEQFAAHLRHGKEWFEPAPDLIEHINTLRAKRKSPPLRGVA